MCLNTTRAKDLRHLFKEMAEVFRSSGIQAHNDFVDIAKEKLGKVNTEDIQAEIRKDIRKVQDENEEMLRKVREYQTNVIKPSDALILLAMAFCNTSTCKKLIKSLPMVIIKANNIKTNKPYIFAIGLFIGLYEWIRAKFHD